jgi:hypothetical protein
MIEGTGRKNRHKTAMMPSAKLRSPPDLVVLGMGVAADT